MEEQKKEEMEGMDSGVDAGNAGDVKGSADVQNVADAQNAEELHDVTDVQENPAGDNGSDSEQEAPAGMPTRSLMLWVLAGIYLIYTGYRLCKNVIDGVEGASIGFMLSGIVFLVIGGGLLFFGVRGVYRADRLKKAQEAAANAQDGPKPEPKAVEPVKDDGRKSMSIAERARLAGRLEEAGDVVENDSEEADAVETNVAETGSDEKISD